MNRTIMRAFEALDYISKADNGLTLTEVTEKLDIPKSSAFNIVQTLVGLNLVSESQYNNKKYVLGSKTYTLGMRYMENLNFVDVCKTYLNPLADELHRNCFVGILDNNKVLYVHKHVGLGAKLAVCDVGTRQELYFTGLGKVLLAFCEPEKRNQIINQITFTRRTSHTICTKEELYQELEKTRQRGYAVDNREVENHMLCFAAPIFNYAGECIAAISISDMYIENADFDYFGGRIKEVGLIISEKLGYVRKDEK